MQNDERRLVVPPKPVREELWHAMRGLQPQTNASEKSRVKHPGGTQTKGTGSSEPYGDDLQKEARTRRVLPPKS